MGQERAPILSLRDLRARAEAALQEQSEPSAGESWGSPAAELPHDIEEVVYELRVHQVELQMQNEELRRAQQEIIDGRDRYLQLYDFSPVACLTVDRMGTVKESNLAAAALVGIERSELIGQPVQAFMRKGDADIFHRHLHAVLTEGCQQRCDLSLEAQRPEELTPADVSLSKRVQIPVHLMSIPLDDRAGHTTGCRSVVIDLSAMRQAEQRRVHLEGKLQRAREYVRWLEPMADAVIPLDRQMRICQWNHAAATLYGISAAEAIGRRFDEALPAANLDAETLAAALFVEGCWNGDLEQRHRSGRLLRVRVTLAQLEDRPGESGGVLVVCRDVSELSDLRVQRSRWNKDEVVSGFAGGVVHDFNNLLSGVIGCCDIALERWPEAPSAEFIRQIRTASQRGARFTRQLLDFMRERQPSREPVDVNATIVTLREMIRSLLGEDIVLRMELRATPGASVLANATELEQIVLNLAFNARDAMPSGGQLVIETADVAHPPREPRVATLSRQDVDGAPELPEGACVMVKVQDTGVGMDDATRARALDPLFTTKAEGRGTGLGLSSVARIVRQLGGHIYIDSEPGRGTVCVLHLPRCGKPTLEEDASSAEQVGANSTGNEVVLVVEDDALVLRTVRHYLQRSGYAVLAAGSVVEALRQGREREQRIDLLLSDVRLPGMDGPHLAQTLRPLQPTMRVLFCSALPHDLLLEQGRLSPTDAFVEKPFTHRAVAAKVRQLLDTPLRQ